MKREIVDLWFLAELTVAGALPAVASAGALWWLFQTDNMVLWGGFGAATALISAVSFASAIVRDLPQARTGPWLLLAFVAAYTAFELVVGWGDAAELRGLIHFAPALVAMACVALALIVRRLRA